MSFVSVNVEEVKEPAPVEEGNYDLVCSNAEEKESKSSGKPMIACTIEIMEHPDAPTIFMFLPLPAEGDEPKARNFKLLQLKRFLTAFDIPFDSDGFNVEDFNGATATQCRVKLSEPDDEGRVRNEVVLPSITE